MAPAPLDKPLSLPPWGPAQLDALRAGLPDRSEPWDLVVVGAGITGAGVARDAAMRGLDVLVLEACDVAYGTSSRSTRLIHGGVRYLEQGELGLVYEALRERARLYAAAPHLVRPARFLFPAYRGDRLGPWKLRLGLTLYDTLNLHRGTGHTFEGPEGCLSLEPLLTPANLLGGVTYEDAVTDDARLTLAVLQSARRHGAQVLTHTPVRGIEGHDGLHHLRLDDGIEVRTRQAVVATGPWTGRQLLGEPGDDLLFLSKGIHLVVEARDVPVRQPLVVQAPGQGRISFVVPWGSRTYLGTTDDPYTGDPGRAGVTKADEVAVLEVVSRALAGARLRPDRVISAWAGVRPLVRPEREARGKPTADISRRHRVVINADGVIGLVGGKLTTFRSMAEELVDEVCRRLQHGHGRAAGPCRTHLEPIVPGPPLSLAERADPLLSDLEPRHGPRARDLATRVVDDPTAGERLIADLPYRWCEVDEAIAHEGALHLTDILRRRLPLALTDHRLGGAVARPIAQRLIDARGGSASDIEEELERYADDIRTETRRLPEIVP